MKKEFLFLLIVSTFIYKDCKNYFVNNKTANEEKTSIKHHNYKNTIYKPINFSKYKKVSNIVSPNKNENSNNIGLFLEIFFSCLILVPIIISLITVFTISIVANVKCSNSKCNKEYTRTTNCNVSRQEIQFAHENSMINSYSPLRYKINDTYNTPHTSPMEISMGINPESDSNSTKNYEHGLEEKIRVINVEDKSFDKPISIMNLKWKFTSLQSIGICPYCSANNDFDIDNNKILYYFSSSHYSEFEIIRMFWLENKWQIYVKNLEVITMYENSKGKKLLTSKKSNSYKSFYVCDVDKNILFLPTDNGRKKAYMKHRGFVRESNEMCIINDFSSMSSVGANEGVDELQNQVIGVKRKSSPNDSLSYSHTFKQIRVEEPNILPDKGLILSEDCSKAIGNGWFENEANKSQIDKDLLYANLPTNLQIILKDINGPINLNWDWFCMQIQNIISSYIIQDGCYAFIQSLKENIENVNFIYYSLEYYNQIQLSLTANDKYGNTFIFHFFKSSDNNINYQLIISSNDSEIFYAENLICNCLKNYSFKKFKEKLIDFNIYYWN